MYAWRRPIYAQSIRIVRRYILVDLTRNINH